MVQCRTELYGVVHNPTVLYGVVQSPTELYGVVQSRTELYGVYMVVHSRTRVVRSGT